MTNNSAPEYNLTIIQHTYCSDCVWINGRISQVYQASGIVRGDDSRRWRVQIVSPPWEREARQSEFPSYFETVDVPAIKLEAGNRVVFASQDPALINDVLVHLKWMLVNRRSNAQIEIELAQFVQNWKPPVAVDACPVAS